MSVRSQDGRLALLTRHFFRALLDFGVLTQEGADAFARVIIGLVSLVAALGLLLVYMYAKKYAALFAASSAGPYAAALVADTTLAIALPMWLVAVVAVLVSHSLFPDETDFRVLMPLPATRQLIFAAKLLALLRFGALFALTTHVAISPLVLLISAGRWASDSVALSFVAFWVASIAASTFALFAVVAANGAVITCLPRSRVHGAVALMRSVMLAALMLALPMVLALPAEAPRLAARSRVLLLAPPAWFMGVQRVLLGHHERYFVELAQIAATALAVAIAVAAVSYAVLYRRFDRVMLHAFGVARGRSFRVRRDDRPARAAVIDFTAATLRRSSLHQGVMIALAGCGVALAVNGALRSGLAQWATGADIPVRQLVGAVTWMPLPLIVVLGIAARASLALPIEPQANWVFRLTERDATRADELHAAERVLTLSAAFVPAILTAPLQWLVAGQRAAIAAAMTSVLGMLWVEVLLRDWQRIPFTCSYMPGKQTVAQSSLAAVTVFFVGGAIGSGLEWLCLRGPSPVPALAIAGVVGLAVAAIRRQRHLRWRQAPLRFDDLLPSEVVRLGID